MKDRQNFEREYFLCIFCLEFSLSHNRTCQNCHHSLVLAEKKELLDELEKCLFYGYQQRVTIERFIEMASPGEPIPSACHLCYSEIIEWIVGLVLTGATWDLIKFSAQYLLFYIKSGKIKFKEADGLIREAQDLDLLEKLVQDEKELKKFVRYINEYKNNNKNLDQRILEETVEIDEEIIEANRELLNELLKNVEKYQRRLET